MSERDGGSGTFGNLTSFESSNLSGKGIAGIISTIVGAIIATVGNNAVEFFNTVADLFLLPLSTVVSGITGIISQIYNATIGIISTGATQTQNSIDFGIISLPVSIVLVIIVFTIVVFYLRWGPSTNFFLFGTGTDVPVIGAEEDEEE